MDSFEARLARVKAKHEQSWNRMAAMVDDIERIGDELSNTAGENSTKDEWIVEFVMHTIASMLHAERAEQLSDEEG